MAKSKPTGNGRKIPAVAYYRVSDPQQDKSIDSQRGEVERWAISNGYRIVDEYIDEGISGWKSDKRDSFKRLIEEANCGAFKAVICWDQDRFSRFPVLEANHYWYLLDKAGVHISTVNQGRLNFRDLGEWLKASITQHGNAEFSVKIARNSLRGRRDSANAGNYVNGGNIAIGMDKLVFNERGELVQRVRFNERFKKPKAWRCELAPSEDSETREAVIWAFETIDREDTSLDAIAREFNRQGIPSRTNKPWRHDTVKVILQNKSYCGRASFGATAKGQFYQMDESGEIVEASGEHKRRAPIYRDGCHEGLISPELFDRVQAKLEQRTTKRARPRNSQYLLSGVINCGHCGNTLWGERDSRRGLEYYRCKECRRRVRRDEVEPFVIGSVRNHFLSPKSIGQFKDAVQQLLASKPKKNAKDAKRLKRELASVTARIERGVENLLLCDAESIPMLESKLAEWRQQRRQIESRLQATESTACASERKRGEMVDQVIGKLFRLNETLSESKPAVVRQAMKENFGVTLWWKAKKPRGYELARGVIEPNANGFFASSGSGGRTRQSELMRLRRALAHPQWLAGFRHPAPDFRFVLPT